jgi:outer membrane immunogenic protein
MKRVLVALAAAVAVSSSAYSADLGAKPVYKAPPVAVMYNWSGVYVGGHVGWGWQEADAGLVVQPIVAFPPGTVFRTRSDGLLAGGQIGVNWQTGAWVFGLEGDFSWTNADGSVTSTGAIPGVGALALTGTIEYNWFATVTGRVGYAANNWLFYVKGGAAFTDFDIGGTVTTLGVLTNTVNALSDPRTGWTVGAGIEHGFAGNWSWKVEYNYMDFGSETYNLTATPAAGITTISHDLTVHAVKFGVNYRFGGM